MNSRELARSIERIPYLTNRELSSMVKLFRCQASREYAMARRWMGDPMYRHHAWARQDAAANMSAYERACLFEIIDRQNKRSRYRRY